jgi:hypothetical protein
MNSFEAVLDNWAPLSIKFGSFRKYWLRLAPLLSLFQTYPSPAVLVDEFDAGCLELEQSLALPLS